MARTEQEIYDSLIVEKNATAELAPLTSVSTTAIWRKWLWLTAKVQHTFEVIFDKFKVEVDAKIAASHPGLPDWYVKKAKAFQYGDVLILDANNVPTYAVIDPTKQIVNSAAVVEADPLLIKVAKLVGGVLGPLTNPELTAFLAYINDIKMAGTNIAALSLNADLLRSTGGTFYYNAQYKLADVKADLDARVAAFLAALPYNGWLYKKKLDDAIQQTLGWVDHDAGLLEATPASAVNWAAIGRYYNPVAGYLTLNQLFSVMLNFEPVV